MPVGQAESDAGMVGWIYIVTYVLAWYSLTSNRAWVTVSSAVTLAYFLYSVGSPVSGPPIASILVVIHCVMLFFSIFGDAR